MKFDFFFTLLKILWKICIKSKNWHLLLHILKKCIITTTKWAIVDVLTRLFQKVINKRFSWSSTFSSLSWKILWKICIKSNNWHLFLHKPKKYIITTTKWALIVFLTRVLQKVINKRFSWISTFSSLSWKILWKICIKSKNWHLHLHIPRKYIITATKWAIIDFRTRLLQKVINKRFSWSSTFSSLSWKILWKICIKSKNWHLLLHRLKKCIITTTKWAIVDFLTRLLQKVINKCFSWSSTFSSLSWKILWKFCIKSNNWHLFLHTPRKYVITATKWAILEFLTCLLQKVINKRFSWSSTFSSLSWKILWKICIKSKNWHLLLHILKKYIITTTKWALIAFLTPLLQKVINKCFSWSSTFSSLSWKFSGKFV